MNDGSNPSAPSRRTFLLQIAGATGVTVSHALLNRQKDRGRQ
jgi:hypothetical protein